MFVYLLKSPPCAGSNPASAEINLVQDLSSPFPPFVLYTFPLLN